MGIYHFILVLLTLNVACQKPFPQTSETAFAVPIPIETTKTSLVFIAGYDEGDNTYYTNARNYFEGKHMRVIDTLFSIDEIMEWMNRNTHSSTEFDEIHIVSHSNPWRGISLKVSKLGQRITLKTLRDAQKKGVIPSVKYGITGGTKIILHACGLGENPALLKEIKNIFTITDTTKTPITATQPSEAKAPAATKVPRVYASNFFNVFGGKYAPHYLAKPYYGFYPTAESPGPMQLAKEFKAVYPETQIDWITALKTRREASLGEAYTYKFNIPVDWEFTFEKAGDIPIFENTDVLMDWISESPEMAEILLELNIPLDKYRWRSEIQGKKLRIKGKTTVLCVLAPILQGNPTGEYRMPVIEDPQLYQIL